MAAASGLDLVPDPGGAAFYGPKISVQAKDALGRTWQMSTIQLDFNLPSGSSSSTPAADGTRQRPVMIHRALFGSIERFFGVLTEHYAGAFPAWLSPVQVVGIPVADAFGDYLEGVVERLRRAGIRAEVDHSDDRMQKKIRNHTTAEGAVHAAGRRRTSRRGAVSFRFRDGTQINGVRSAERRRDRHRLDRAPREHFADGGGWCWQRWQREAAPGRRPTVAQDGIGVRSPGSGCGRRTGWPTSPVRGPTRAATTRRPAARSAGSRRCPTRTG